MSILKTFNDLPEASCNLNRKPLIEAIVQQIENVTPPKAIAINGTWGTGKTSVMLQAYNQLGGKKFNPDNKPTSKATIKPVWFEAWQFQNEPNILAALLLEIRDQLSWYFEAQNAFKKFSDGAFNVFWNSLNFTLKENSKIGPSLEMGIKDIGSKYSEGVRRYEKDTFSEPLQSITLRTMLEDAIDKLVEGKNFLDLEKKTNYKAVIFIDDLDRCEPEVAFKILEVIKLYLNLRNCIFVLGVDMEALERIIAKYYEKLLSDKADLKHLARLYLEKICQDTYHVLPLSSPEKRHFFNTLIKKVKVEADEDQKKILDKIVYIQDTEDFLPPFPRSIKLFTNVLINHLNYLEKNKINSTALEKNLCYNKLIILCYLNAFHFELYQLTHLYSEDKFYDEFLLAFCKNPHEFLSGTKDASKKYNHALLDSIILPFPDLDETEADGTIKDYARLYPHTSLRQVLWIRKLILETENLIDSEIQMLRIK